MIDRDGCPIGTPVAEGGLKIDDPAEPNFSVASHVGSPGGVGAAFLPVLGSL